MENLNNHFQLQKVRDFGLVISDTFDFIKLNFKPLFSAIIIIVIPFCILYGVLAGLGFASLIETITNDPAVFDDPEMAFESFTGLFIKFIPSLILLLIASILLVTITFTYIKMFREGKINSDITTREIWDNSKSNIGTITITIILAYLLTILGAMMCVIPGIFISIPLIMIFMVRLEEPELGFIDAVKRCLELVKNCWWVTFALIFVIGLLVALVQFVFALPMQALLGFSDFLEFGGFGIIAAVSSAISMVVQFLTTTVTYVASAIIYYSHRERLEGTGLQKRIDSIGTTDDFLPDSAGEY